MELGHEPCLLSGEGTDEGPGPLFPITSLESDETGSWCIVKVIPLMCVYAL